MAADSVHFFDRLLAVSCYLGLAPLTGFWRSRSSSQFLRHHFAQAMAGGFVALIAVLVACAFEICEYVLIFGDESRFGTVLYYLDFAEVVVLGSLLPLWVTLLGLALLGSKWQVPGLKQLSLRRWPAQISLLVNSAALASVPILAVLSIWASSMTRLNNESGKVYFLYDEGIGVPRWGYALGLSRISLQAQRNWGKGRIVLDRLNKETLRTAFANGSVVILATHGESGYAVTYYAPEAVGVWPPDSGALNETRSSHFLRAGLKSANNKWDQMENLRVNEGLQLTYVFACHAGEKASQWQEHLAPAEVVTYNRFSSVWDHALWFAFTGPAKLQRLK